MKIIIIRTSTDFLLKKFSRHFFRHFISVFFSMFPSFFLFPSSLSLSISQIKSQYTILPIFPIGISISNILLLSPTILFGFRRTLFRCPFSLISSPYLPFLIRLKVSPFSTRTTRYIYAVHDAFFVSFT